MAHFTGFRDQIVTSLYRCTALLLHAVPSSPPPPSPPPPLSPLLRSLLSPITQLPVHTFTEVAITTAIQCWQWLLTAGQILEIPVCLQSCSICCYLLLCCCFVVYEGVEHCMEVDGGREAWLVYKRPHPLVRQG